MDLIFVRFVVFQMRMRSHLLGLQTCVFCLKLLKGLFYIYAYSKSPGETVILRRPA